MERIVENEQETLKLQGFTREQSEFLWSLKLLVRDGRLGGPSDDGNPFKSEGVEPGEESSLIESGETSC